ncbi:olfactory receptor 6C76-like [Pyxicephalus adspersus]
MTMMVYNQTLFSLAGFTINPILQIYVVLALVLVYIISVSGNIVTISATSLVHDLQKPMYFFLRSLATLDILFISSTVPKLLEILITGDNDVVLSGCLLQLYIYVSAGGTVFYTLGLLSIDRYIAVCHPLQYSTIMTYQLCWRSTIASWTFGFLVFIPSIVLMSQLQWCRAHAVIDHFFCDGSALLRLACSDTQMAETLFSFFACFAVVGSIIPTISSYCFILLSIFSISSPSGRSKTFSTCSSHFVAVVIVYGSCILIYVIPKDTLSCSPAKTVAIFNSILSPFLHPFIYTLRNQVVISSLKRKCKLSDKIIVPC